MHCRDARQNAEIFFFHSVQTGCGAHVASYSAGTGRRVFRTITSFAPFYSLSDKLLPVLASTVIFGSASRRAHDRILLSHDSGIRIILDSFYSIHFQFLYLV
jgi:hypothetical protein